MSNTLYALIRILVILAAIMICAPLLALDASGVQLTMLHLRGNQSPSLGLPAVYTVRVKNIGNRDCDALWVELNFWRGAPISRSDTFSLAAGAMLDIPFSCEFSPGSPNWIIAQLHVQDPGAEIHTAYQTLRLRFHDELNIGYTSYVDTKSLSNEAYNLYYKSSLYQCIYYPDDIGQEGLITKLNIYFMFRTVQNIQAPIRIWMGHTDRMELSDGFVDASSMTLVYDDSPLFPYTPGVVKLTLQTPFVYQGGNLALMIFRPFSNATYLQDNEFYGALMPTFRSRSAFTNTLQINVFDPPASTAGNFVLSTEFGFAPDLPEEQTQIFDWQHELGIVPLGNRLVQHLSIVNRGAQAVHIYRLNLFGSAAFEFATLPRLPLRLAPGQTVQCAAILKASSPGIKRTEFQVFGADERPLTVKTLQFEVQGPGFTLPVNEDFSRPGMELMPLGWDALNLSDIPKSYVFHSHGMGHESPGYVAMFNSTGYSGLQWLVAPPLELEPWQNQLIVKFWAKSNIAAQIILGLMDETLSSSGFEPLSSFEINTDWSQYHLHLAAPPDGKRIAFKHGGTAANISIHLDEIAIERIAGHDLALEQLRGGRQFFRGVMASHSIEIKNWGHSPEYDYLVSLEDESGSVLWQGSGPSVLPLQSIIIEAVWTPQTVGEMILIAKVSMRQDENSQNNRSRPLQIRIYEPDEGYLELGSDQRRELLPFDFAAKASLYEVILTHQQMQNFYGWISSITLWAHFANPITNKPFRIWMGTTSQENLEEGWIVSNELELVYTGTINVQPGSCLLHLPLIESFDYRDGKNLVILISRDWDIASFGTGNRFQNWNITPGQARGVSSSNQTIDPEHPLLGEVLDYCPRLGFELSYGGIGQLGGRVLDLGGQPIADAYLTLNDGKYHTQSLADGSFSLINIPSGMAQLEVAKYSYRPETYHIEIPELGLLCVQPRLSQYPSLSISGRIVASDTQAGASGAHVSITGYMQAEAICLGDGSFFISGIWGEHQYRYEITKDGYSIMRGIWDLQQQNLDLGDIIISELAWPAQCVLAVEAEDEVQLQWLAPEPDSWDLSEDFESAGFPPQSWQQVITNDSPAESSGILPTWCSFGEIHVDGQSVHPPSGEKQAGLWWSYSHQDEWLISPSFNCPYQAQLSFETFCRYGSDSFGSYSVKLSADGGESWLVLWEAANQPSGWNRYQIPVQTDLANWGGMPIQLAWHAQDSSEQSGLWYLWLIDAISIHNQYTCVKLSMDLHKPGFTINRGKKDISPKGGNASKNPEQRQTQSKVGRGLEGYRIARSFRAVEHTAETWTVVAELDSHQLAFTDEAWNTLGNGWYRWSVWAVYANGVQSAPAYSNTLRKHIITGSLAGIVRSHTQAPIPGATITAGIYQASTNAAGAYNLILPTGAYNVTASAPGYQSHTQDEVLISEDLTTTLNFLLYPGSEADDTQAPALKTQLNSCYPNPFSHHCTIRFELDKALHTRIELYDLRGRKVSTIIDETLASARYEHSFSAKETSGTSLPNGIYFLKMQAGGKTFTRKIVLKK